MRIIAAEYIISYAKLLKQCDGIKYVASDFLPVIRSCFEDASWKIRLAISKNFGDLAACFDSYGVSTGIELY